MPNPSESVHFLTTTCKTTEPKLAKLNGKKNLKSLPVDDAKKPLKVPCDCVRRLQDIGGGGWVGGWLIIRAS